MGFMKLSLPDACDRPTGLGLKMLMAPGCSLTGLLLVSQSSGEGW